MLKLYFDYFMEIDYGGTVDTTFFTMKCIPADTLRQKLIDYRISIDPEHVMSEDCDSFGARQIYGRTTVPHEIFRYQIEGQVEMYDLAYEEEVREGELFLYRRPFGLNKAGEEIRKYFDKIMPSCKANAALDQAIAIMHRLHQDFRYVPGSTDLMTSAEEAWKLGEGVCQDYTHVFIALMHLAGIPCRYVAGLLQGEGATHAWAEILDGDKWYGLDPTNDMAVDEKHIKLGHGRDASDCHINRGLIRNSFQSGSMGQQSQLIRCVVREAE